MVDIIIVKYCNKIVEDKCIQSVVEHTDSPYGLRVHDNYPQNENLGKLWNRLIRQSDSEFICLLNSDTTITYGWIGDLVGVFNRDSRAGIVGPSTDHSRNQQSKPNETGNNLVDFGKKFPGWCLSGFCLVFPKQVWEVVGGFPEDFGFYGQEVAFIDKIVKAGYKQIWRSDVFVHHEGSSSAKAAEARGEMNEAAERVIARIKLKDHYEN